MSQDLGLSDCIEEGRSAENRIGAAFSRAPCALNSTRWPEIHAPDENRDPSSRRLDSSRRQRIPLTFSERVELAGRAEKPKAMAPAVNDVVHQAARGRKVDLVVHRKWCDHRDDDAVDLLRVHHTWSLSGPALELSSPAHRNAPGCSHASDVQLAIKALKRSVTTSWFVLPSPPSAGCAHQRKSIVASFERFSGEFGQRWRMPAGAASQTSGEGIG